MREALIFLIVIVVLSIACVSGINGQSPDPSDTPATVKYGNAEKNEGSDRWQFKRGAHELSLEFGFAPMQPTFFSGRKEYDTDGRQFAMASFRWGRVIGTKHGVTYQYMFRVIPVSFAIKNEVWNPDRKYDAPDGQPETVRRTTYGFGIEPAGFRFIFMPKRRLKPFAQTAAGFLFSRKPIPVPQSPNYNFIGEFGGGLSYSITPRRTVNFGYRYFHISNMNIGEINPGYNANVFYIGYSFFSK